MQDILLLVGMTVWFVFGWFLMKRLDCFLINNEKELESKLSDDQKNQSGKSRKSVL